MPLGFTHTSTRKEREDKLLLRLGKLKHPYFLCIFNQPFNVHFSITQHYNVLTDAEKQKLLRKFLLKLMKNCFQELWVVIIDDAEYCDPESLGIFDVFTKKDMIFFVLSIGRKLSTDFPVYFNLLHRGKVIELIGIDRWYHAGLVCQILNVKGLPAELEKRIQEKSLGNPGWIESYLVSLLQIGHLEIINITKKEARIKGYVLPPTYMLKRYTADLTNGDAINHDDRKDKWQIYRTSFKDSAISLLEKSISGIHKPHLIDDDDDEVMIAVCNISESFVFEDVEPGITMDVMILKLFDSLTPLDQLLLKCASVIGETVNRHMLESLMSGTSKREIALELCNLSAVTKLFEIRVFGCAVGDFIKNTGPIILIRNMQNHISEMDLFCKCIGLDIPDELADLPRYASCGFMRFKMSMFRNTTYQLLTENQKIELHNQALKYLQQHTRRCASCGQGHFAKLLGKVAKKEERKKKLIDVNETFDVAYKDVGATKNEVPKKPKRRPTDIEEILEVEYNDEGVTEKRKKSKLKVSCLNLFRSVEKKPTLTFSNVDFSNCLCDLILMTVYIQILDHCRGIGKLEMTLTALLEFAEICLLASNIPQTRKLLSESETVLEKLFESDEDEMVLLPYLTAKIQTLQGQCFLESGSIFEAEETLEMALNSLGYKFPKLEIMIDLNSMVQLVNLKLKLICFNDTNELNTNLEGDDVDYTKQLSECLARMFELFRFKGMKKHARLAAIWGLNAALDSKKDLHVLCTAYTNMIITAHMYQERYLIPYLEQRGINICNENREALDSKELNVIAEFYAGIFFSRWLKGQLSKAIQIGFICCRMANTIGSTFLKLLILPRLAHLLMISCRHSEVVTQLRELEFVSRHDLDKSGCTWYYALCADVHLDTGLTILSFQACEQYFLQEGEQMISLYDPEAERRYFTSMWLWCIRTEEWEAAKVWSGRKVESTNVTDEHIVAATITSLKKLEGLLILYVHKLNSRNADAAVTMMEIKSIFKDAKKISKIVEIAIPRYMLLKAYYWMIRSQVNVAMKLLKKLQRVCQKMENKMIYTWALHCEKVLLK
ncbi:hypothetical protein K0M31_008591 [Melipona bicolor]|uniref:Adenylate cyclase type 10 n=1 Tax=Melipona bicolor TaxID=60889 RepID=A0AA40KJT9_9HYME|nr:hypothetical protein K0M31_008591 [Melipona bicolor]